jgi:hypothetical protein
MASTGTSQPDELHGASLVSGGKGALLTALAYSAVRSHQAVRAAGSPLPKESGMRDPSPVCRVYRSNRSNAKRRLFTGVRGRGILRTSPITICANFAQTEFYEVELLISRFLGSSPPEIENILVINTAIE